MFCSAQTTDMALVTYYYTALKDIPQQLATLIKNRYVQKYFYQETDISFELKYHVIFGRSKQCVCKNTCDAMTQTMILPFPDKDDITLTIYEVILL